MPKSLRLVASGEKVKIITVNAAGEIGRRLRDMGLSPGTDIEILGRAPLKDPISLRLKNYTLTLRNNEADYITVERLKS